MKGDTRAQVTPRPEAPLSSGSCTFVCALHRVCTRTCMHAVCMVHTSMCACMYLGYVHAHIVGGCGVCACMHSIVRRYMHSVCLHARDATEGPGEAGEEGEH